MRDYGLMAVLTVALLFFGIVGFLMGFGVGVETVESQQQVVTEQHYITEIADGFVRTEQVRGKGEGTIYPAQLYVMHGITPKVGKRVDFGWAAQDYEDEVWERVHELTEVDVE